MVTDIGSDAGDDDLKEYNLDHYDSDEVDDDGEKITMFGNVKSLAYHQPNEEDPYLVMPDDEEEQEERERAVRQAKEVIICHQSA